MAIWDWPTAACFVPREVQVGVRTPKAGWQAAFSGDRTQLSHQADRLRMTLRLPGCTPGEGAVREAFFGEVVSAGHQLRIARLDRPRPSGTLMGSPVVAVAAAAGARSLQLRQVAGANLLLNGSFELDGNGDGLCDGWELTQSGSVSGLIATRESGAPEDGLWEQGLEAVFGAAGVAHYFGLERTVACSPGAYAVAASVRGGANLRAWLVVECRNGGGAIIADFTVVDAAVASVSQRVGGYVTAPSETVSITVRLLCYATAAPGVGQIRWDVAMLKPGASDFSWPGPGTLVGGDCLGTGGQMVVCSWSGATATDAGDMTVPLMIPLRRPVSVGDAVTWQAPAAKWDLLLDAVELSYHRGRWQRELELPFQEVP